MKKDVPVPTLDEESQHFFEESVMKPMANQIVDHMPPSKLETRKHKYDRTLEQLRTSFSSYKNCFAHAGRLLAEAKFTWEGGDSTQLEAFLKQPKVATEKLMKEGQTLQDLVQLSDEDIQRIYAIARKYYEHKEFQNAGDLFLLLMTLCPGVATFCTGLGMVEQQLGHYEMAAALYALAAELNPDDPSVYLYSAHCLYLQNHKTDAIRLIDTLIEAIGHDDDWQELKEQATSLKESWKHSV